MRLDFNVLWVDDQPNSVGAQITAIQKRMEEEGFQFNARVCRSIDEVRDAISDNVFADEVDLILVDWDLGSGTHGQDAIVEIRDTVRFKDVVFYSAQTSPDELRKAAFENNLEGVFCANRDHLVDEVMGVFDSLVKKVLDLDHTRGIVMGSTSDIDFMVNECLIVIHDQADNEGKGLLLAQGREFIEGEIEELKKLAEKMSKVTSFPELFDAHSVFTAYDRLRVLARALDTKALEAHKGYRPKVTSYQQDVVPKRNVLGHVARVEKDGAYVLVDRKGKVYDLESTRDLRRLILALRADFRELLAALKAVGGGTGG